MREGGFEQWRSLTKSSEGAGRVHPPLHTKLRRGFEVTPYRTLPRVASCETTVAGYFIPKGSQVLVSHLGLGRNPEVWDDPLTFSPDRHMNGNKEVVLTDNSLHMLSYSTGRRGYPGVLLGSTMAVMLLARLIPGFSTQ
ncbi:putative tryptophan N-monooxygenase [Helianthus annuus]|nr:putative tryptophan N-monooxygenase [Helianthus annuus]KAJ0888174.1 putative tryptophan N-monooxygenase [Helianthus annuus]KAJ0959414.1 putative tryptophan N-monooxygenase [Helianthus annuus]